MLHFLLEVTFIHSRNCGLELQTSEASVRRQTVINKTYKKLSFPFGSVRSVHASVNFWPILHLHTTEAALHHYIYGQSACRLYFYFTYWTNFKVLSWLERSNRCCSIIICSSAAVVLPKGSLRVIDNRSEGLFFNLFRDSTWQLSWLLIILPSSAFSSSHHLSSSQASSSSPSSSLSLHRVLTGHQPAAARSHSLIKFGSGKHFTTLSTHTHSSCYRAVPAPIGWQSQTSYCSKTGLW